MAKIIVAGLINLETTIQMEQFPIEYQPVNYAFDKIKSSVSGVGFNLAKCLTILGHQVDLLSIIGRDQPTALIHAELKKYGVERQHVISSMMTTPQSVVLYDPTGKRMVNTDLKDIQETSYPLDNLRLNGVDLAVMTNINFTRLMLPHIKQLGIPIATDIHAIRDIDDDYNRDYMRHADILFMSHERLPVSPEAWVHQLWDTYGTPIIGIGMGAEGAIVAVKADNCIEQVPAKSLRPIVNTVGAGDALFSSFVHSYLQDSDPYLAIRKATVFASYKAGFSAGGEGFMNASQLDDLYLRLS